jgi:hypothetical protein
VAQLAEQKTRGDDSRLAEVVDAWPGLSERTKRKIVILVEADERERRKVASATQG